jgi:hypothetical protein
MDLLAPFGGCAAPFDVVARPSPFPLHVTMMYVPKLNNKQS